MSKLTGFEFYKEDKLSAFAAQRNAYWISFAPVVFQVSRVLLQTGILESIDNAGKQGIAFDEVVTSTSVGEYQARVLLHAGLGIGLVNYRDDKYFIAKTGHFLLHDQTVRINLDFTNDVCYQGLFDLDKSIAHEKPEGLKVFGNWPTIYEGLSQLPAPVQKSWFALDHRYSDEAFPAAIAILLNEVKPNRILDIGGNTGRFCRKIMETSKDIHVTIVDLPGQLNMAMKALKDIDVHNQVDFYQANMLDPNTELPKGFDTIWMSQFLDCFSEAEIIAILKKCATAAGKEGRICIQEGFWDMQKNETAAFALQQFSIYFTAMANGNSQMYDYVTFKKCIEKAGLIIESEHHNISISNSLLICRVQ